MDGEHIRLLAGVGHQVKKASEFTMRGRDGIQSLVECKRAAEVFGLEFSCRLFRNTIGFSDLAVTVLAHSDTTRARLDGRRSQGNGDALRSMLQDREVHSRQRKHPPKRPNDLLTVPSKRREVLSFSALTAGH